MAWPLEALRRGGRRQRPPTPRTEPVRWPAALAGLLGLALTARFTALIRCFATTSHPPGEQVARLTRGARLLVPLTGAALLGAVPVLRRTDLSSAERAHYVAVRSAEVVLLGWPRKWHLIGGP